MIASIPRGLLIVLVCGILWPAAAADAHEPADLALGSPAPNAMYATVPPRLQLVFSEELDGEESQVRVTGPAGQRADRRDLQVDGARMVVSLYDQGPGVYRVSWRAMTDEDQRRSRGQYTFTIQPNLPPNAPRISVTPGRAANGAPVTVAGSGFAPSGTVVLTVGDAEELLALVQTDGRGSFSTSVSLPSDLPHGRQVVQAADATDHQATYALWVPEPGGLGVAAVRVSCEAEEGVVSCSTLIENRGNFRLRNLVVRVRVPEGTAVLAEGLEQPEDASNAELANGEVVWRLPRLARHTVQGPFTFNVTTAGLSGRPTLDTVATLSYVFTDTPSPGVRGQVRSPDVSVQAVSR